MPEPLQQCTAWLRAYFCEPPSTGTLPVPAFHHPLLQRDSFTRQVLWTLLNDVKFGEAVSYKQLAHLAGNSRAARAVGGAMRSNPIPIIIPCHRVIRSSGDSGNYGGGQLLKEWLLSHEKLQKEKLQKEKEKLAPKLSEHPAEFREKMQNGYSDPSLLRRLARSEWPSLALGSAQLPLPTLGHKMVFYLNRREGSTVRSMQKTPVFLDGEMGFFFFFFSKLFLRFSVIQSFISCSLSVGRIQETLKLNFEVVLAGFSASTSHQKLKF
ncbi:Methylated-DNA--protein-cysteine methyltransferase, partial [Lamprotornis superbus]